MKDALIKKNHSLKLAIERYNKIKRFVDSYKRSKSLDDYINFVRLSNNGASEDTIAYYESMIAAHNRGDDSQLVSNMYDKLLAADDYRNKLASEIKAMIKEIH